MTPYREPPPDETSISILGALEGLAAEGTGILVASHDDRVKAHATRTLTLASGKLSS